MLSRRKPIGIIVFIKYLGRPFGSGDASKICHELIAGLIDIANHGNTHCVLGKHLPQFFSSNRN